MRVPVIIKQKQVVLANFTLAKQKLSFTDATVADIPTHKIPVERDKAGSPWTITATSPRGQIIEHRFIYGEVKIKKDTGIGKGLTVPKNQDFTVFVKGPGLQETKQFEFTG